MRGSEGYGKGGAGVKSRRRSGVIPRGAGRPMEPLTLPRAHTFTRDAGMPRTGDTYQQAGIYRADCKDAVETALSHRERFRAEVVAPPETGGD